MDPIRQGGAGSLVADAGARGRVADAGTGGSPGNTGARGFGGAQSEAGTSGHQGGGASSSEGSVGKGGAPSSTGGSTGRGGATAHNGGSKANTGGSAGKNSQPAAGGVNANTGGSNAGSGGRPVTEGGVAGVEPCADYAAPTVTGRLSEGSFGASGVVASRKQPGVLWIHSDRQKILYAIDETGKSLGQWEITSGARFFYIYNWEDISLQSMDGGPDRIWIGDIGNNFVRGDSGTPRTSIRIMSIDEPVVDFDQPANGTAKIIDDLEITYPDGLHDSEAMAIDPLTGDLYVLSKEEKAPSGIYRAKAPLKSGALERIGSVSANWLNGADFSPSGREFVVRNYSQVFYWALQNGQTWSDAFEAAPSKKMNLKRTDNAYGEAIAFSADASGFYVVSEVDEGAAPSPVEFYVKNCK